MKKTAGIIIIGDEVLSGMVQDCNSAFMARELRRTGIEVRRISVISDDADTIAEEVGKFSARFDYVFTSGGIGPTHDDVTIYGIAGAFGVQPVINEHLRDFLRKVFGNNLSPAQLRMAEVPEGASAIRDETIGLPLIHFRNIYILPGVPRYLREKFHLIAKLLFNGGPPLMKKIYITEYESVITPLLNGVVAQHSEVKVGSYPAVEKSDYNVMITMESYSEERLNSAVRQFLENISPEKIVRVEG
jgi:molybdenum cofactor synthesis domain-containing protein